MNQNETELTTVVENNKVELTGIDYSQVVKQLIANGAKRYNNLRVRSTSVTELERYARVVFSLDKYLPAFVQDDNGEYVEGHDARIITSNFALSGVLKNIEDIAMLANGVGNMEKCQKIPVIFSGANLDVVQVRYAAGEDVVNPFSSNAEPTQYDHDIIVNYVVNIKLGKAGQTIVDNILAQTAASFID